MFTAALFTKAKLWKQPRCPTTDKGISLIKNVYSTKAIYLLGVIPIKIPMAFITEVEKSTLEFKILILYAKSPLLKFI
jgi:hypothetical protein